MKNNENAHDLIYKSIAEKYIPDTETTILFKEDDKTNRKIIAVGYRDNDSVYYHDNISIYIGDTWKEALDKSGYYGGLLDQDEDYFDNWCPEYTEEEIECVLKDRAKYWNTVEAKAYYIVTKLNNWVRKNAYTIFEYDEEQDEPDTAVDECGFGYSDPNKIQYICGDDICDVKYGLDDIMQMIEGDIDEKIYDKLTKD